MKERGGAESCARPRPRRRPGRRDRPRDRAPGLLGADGQLRRSPSSCRSGCATTSSTRSGASSPTRPGCADFLKLPGLRPMFLGWSPPGESPLRRRSAQAGSEREALLRVAAAAAGAHDLEEVLEVAAEEARAAIGAASLSVSRWEREQGGAAHDHQRRRARARTRSATRPPRSTRSHEDPQRRAPHPRGRPYFNSVDDAGHRRRLGAARCCGSARSPRSACRSSSRASPGARSTPTTAPGQPRFRGEDVRFLETVAGQLAVAIGRAELFSRVSRLAYEDPLTGLANRRALEERLQRAVARADRAQRHAGGAALRRRRAEGDQRRRRATTPATARCSAWPRRWWRPRRPRARATSSAACRATSSAS